MKHYKLNTSHRMLFRVNDSVSVYLLKEISFLLYIYIYIKEIFLFFMYKESW